jgi:hypothetical protein
MKLGRALLWVLRKTWRLLLGYVLGFATGVVLAASLLLWVVFAANGVRDLALIGMSEQGHALQQCLHPQQQVAPPVKEPPVAAGPARPPMQHYRL